MKIKGANIQDLVEVLSDRSKCRVKVAALLHDSAGVFSWGWNFGNGIVGVHAEEHAFKRANKRRLNGSKIIVYGRWACHGKEVEAIPCEKCMKLCVKFGVSAYTYKTKGGTWRTVKLN